MGKKPLPSAEHVETLSLVAMGGLVGGLVEELNTLKADVAAPRSENEALRQDNAELRLKNVRLKVENQQLRDDIARLTKLPPRPPFRPRVWTRQQIQPGIIPEMIELPSSRPAALSVTRTGSPAP